MLNDVNVQLVSMVCFTEAPRDPHRAPWEWTECTVLEEAQVQQQLSHFTNGHVEKPAMGQGKTSSPREKHSDLSSHINIHGSVLAAKQACLCDYSSKKHSLKSEVQKKKNLLRPKTNVHQGTWNVQTMYETSSTTELLSEMNESVWWTGSEHQVMS